MDRVGRPSSAGSGVDVAGPDRLAAGPAYEHLAADLAAPVMDDLEGRTVGRRMDVPPLAHGGEHRPQVPALGRQPVVVPGGCSE